MIGPVPGYEGLWVSTGHFRTGAKEAPGTAVLVAEALTTGTIPDLLGAFAPASQAVTA
jgi:glycine/D-amino acid oxidase-like deaminating enzyme